MSFLLTLRQEQVKDVQDVHELIDSGVKRVVLVRPTGSGKTVCAASMMEEYRQRGMNVCFMVERRALIEQTSWKLSEAGVPHGVVMAGYHPSVHENVQLISRDTLRERCLKRKSMYLPPADVFFRDEAHRGLTKSDRAIYDAYGEIPHIGLTATPALRDGRGLGFFYQALVHNITHQALVDQGLLLPNVIFCPAVFDPRGLKHREGDFLLSDENAAQVEKQVPVGDCVRDWYKYSEFLPTVAFCTTVKHARWLAEEFRSSGVSAAVVDMHTSLEERERIRCGSRDGSIRVVTSCEVMGYGVDWPWLACCIHLRPCKSIVPWIQFCGRANRTWEGQKYAVQIDHVGNCARLGFPEDCDHWTLDGHSPRQKDGTLQKKPEARCASCQAVKKRAGPCEYCGHVPEVKIRPDHIEFEQGELKRAERQKPQKRSHEQREWDYCLGVAIGTGRTLKAAGSFYKSRNGKWPDRSLKKCPMSDEWGMDAREWYDTKYKRHKENYAPTQVSAEAVLSTKSA